MAPVGYRDVVEGTLPGTKAEIVAKTGLTDSTVVRWLRIMQDEVPRACHITAWKRTVGAGGHQPIYTAGPGANMPCRLKRKTDCEYSRNYRLRIKGTEAGDARISKQRAWHWAKKATQTGDPLVNALFGKGSSSSENTSSDATIAVENMAAGPS